MCTTVGESFADYINETLGFGLTNTTVVFSVALIATLVAQFRLSRYVTVVYWKAAEAEQALLGALPESESAPGERRCRLCVGSA